MQRRHLFADRTKYHLWGGVKRLIDRNPTRLEKPGKSGILQYILFRNNQKYILVSKTGPATDVKSFQLIYQISGRPPFKAILQRNLRRILIDVT
jgi:hypothetical protein